MIIIACKKNQTFSELTQTAKCLVLMDVNEAERVSFTTRVPCPMPTLFVISNPKNVLKLYLLLLTLYSDVSKQCQTYQTLFT